MLLVKGHQCLPAKPKQMLIIFDQTISMFLSTGAPYWSMEEHRSTTNLLNRYASKQVGDLSVKSYVRCSSKEPMLL